MSKNKSMNAWFVAGTDTGVGKTLVAAALITRLRERHTRVIGMKPVAAGAERMADATVRNDDVVALQAASSLHAPSSIVNPYLLMAAASPHIAARHDGVVIEIARIVQAFASLRERADAIVVEGAGGFRVPLTDTLDGADLAVALGLPIVLVVGLRLGCLNHALLTADSIDAHGLRLAGWVANRIDADMPEQDANIELLMRRLDAPCLADLPHSRPPDVAGFAARLSLPDEFFE
jgi:dethiobiotin synthetase